MSTQAELLDRAVAGDRDALQELLQHHTADARRGIVIPARFRSILSVDDILQETYTDAFLNIRGFRHQDGSSFGSWLRTLALNNLRDGIKCLQTLKREGGGHWTQVGSEGDSMFRSRLLGADSNPRSKAASQEGIAAIRQAMQGLSEPHRRVVQLYDFEERSVVDVAAELGRSVGATFMLRERAMRKLEDILGTRSMYLS